MGSWVRIPPEAAHFLWKKRVCLGCYCVVLYCAALFVVSFDHVHVHVYKRTCKYLQPTGKCVYMYMYMLVYSRTLKIL